MYLKYLILFLSFISLNCGGKPEDESPHKPVTSSTFKPGPSTNSDVYLIPRYGIILLAVTMILMFFTILLLMFIIMKQKRKEIAEAEAIIERNEIKDVTTKYVREMSGDNAEIIFSYHKNVNEPISRCESSNTLLENAQTPSRDNIISTISESKRRHPSVSKVLKYQQVAMNREQMKKLCEAVLSKTTQLKEASSLTDLERILDEAKEVDKQKNGINKSASTPVLEETGSGETYDLLPSPRRLSKDKVVEIIDEIYESPRSPIKSEPL